MSGRADAHLTARLNPLMGDGWPLTAKNTGRGGNGDRSNTIEGKVIEGKLTEGTI